MECWIRPNAAILALAVATLGCRNHAPASADLPARVASVKVARIELGRAVGLDKRVSEATDAFLPADTVYASVVTEGSAPHVELKARWTRGQQQLAETKQSIAPQGEATSEFHISKPRGWPPGRTRSVKTSAT